MDNADFTGPSLTSFSTNKTEIDISNNSSSVIITASASDSSGVDSQNSYVYLRSPSGVQIGAKRFDDCENGCTFSIPQSYEAGLYSFYVNLADESINVNRVTIIPNETIQVVNSNSTSTTTTSVPQDTSPPALDSFSFSPNNINVTSSSVDVTVTISASDPSGVSYFSDVKLQRIDSGQQISKN